MSFAVQYYWYIKYRRKKTNEARRIERRRLRDQLNPFELRETEFRNLFRISRDMAKDLIDELAPFLVSKSSCGLPMHIKVSVFNMILY